MHGLRSTAERTLDEINRHLKDGTIPFWLTRGVDDEYGGFLTCFDADGVPTGDTDKYIVTQTRMVWGMSALHKDRHDSAALLRQARQGVDFLIEHFWDSERGGWYWRTGRDGKLLDGGKVVYGQSFAIYALSEYTLATGDARGLEYAEETGSLSMCTCT